MNSEDRMIFLRKYNWAIDTVYYRMQRYCYKVIALCYRLGFSPFTTLYTESLNIYVPIFGVEVTGRLKVEMRSQVGAFICLGDCLVRRGEARALFILEQQDRKHLSP